MIAFLIGAALLLALTLAFLLLPLLRHNEKAKVADRQAINAAIYRDELAELKRDLAEGALSQQDYDEALAELQRRLLEDAQDDGTAVSQVSGSRYLKPTLALAMPLAAAALYFFLGAPAALEPSARPHRFSAAEIEQMVQALADRLAKEPDNVQGWAMLARSYKVLGRHDAAAEAYARIEAQIADNADLLADYAEAYATAHGGFDEKSIRLLEKALAQDAKHPQALWLRGMAHLEAGQHDDAIARWQQLLALLPPGSEEAAALAAHIERIRSESKAK